MHLYEGVKHCCVEMTEINRALKGLVIDFRDKYGPEALLPERKQPLSYQVIHELMKLGLPESDWPEGKRIGTRKIDRVSFFWCSLFAMIGLLKATGFRKAEVSIGVNDSFGLRHISRANVVWFTYRETPSSGGVKAKEELNEPTLEQLQDLRDGDILCVAPPPAKADQAGDKYGNFFTYHVLKLNDPTNTAWVMLQMEILFPIQSHDRRRKTPLFGTEVCIAHGGGKPFTHAQLDHILPLMLADVSETHPALLDLNHIKRYSWHSFRSALACALKAMSIKGTNRVGQKVDDPTIQAMCRWATQKSIGAYGRLSAEQYGELLQEASEQNFDSVQAVHLLKKTPRTDDDDRFAFAQSLVGELAYATD